MASTMASMFVRTTNIAAGDVTEIRWDVASLDPYHLGVRQTKAESFDSTYDRGVVGRAWIDR